ncbi:MAG TPA: methionyl-tRNA formyltransferase [Acidimicrobiales bacterium]
MRLVFLGTPDAAVPPLRALVGAGHDVALVVTRADKRRGRGTETSPSPVKAAALELGLPVSHRVDDVLETGAELGVVVAFGQIIKPHVLARVPMVNLHFSLLPRWRGAAPVERAILAGDAETGVAVMDVEEGLDTGGVYREDRVVIHPNETAGALRSRLVAVGTDLLVEALAQPLGEPVPQTGEPTYAAKVTPEDLALDWRRPAVELARIPRVGRAWTTFRGKRLLVLEARAVPTGPEPGVLEGAVVGTADGGLELVTVQPEGKAPGPVAAWRNGARPVPGERLGG